MDDLTELEKLLYNKHLAVSRSLKNKPFKFKKDFSDIVNSDKAKFLKRLSVLFRKHPEIDFNTFFEAPYKLYPDVDYFGLDYFSSMRAIKAYTTYKKITFLQDPDKQVEQVKSSLQFIAKFCVDEGIYFHQYSFHKTADIFTWMKHYKENKINIYCMFGFSDVLNSVKQLAEDVQHFFVREFVEQFQTLYVQYDKSSVLKPYMKKALPILNNFVERELTNHKNKLKLTANYEHN
jgi:hypothetical protein